MATSSFSPATRRFVGWLLVLTGMLAGLGLAIRLGVLAYGWAGSELADGALPGVALPFLGLVGAGLLVRYGRRLLRGGHLSDGPADEIIV